MNIAIQGVGVVGGFGTGIAALRQALSDRHVQPVAVNVKTGSDSVEFPAFLADTALLLDYIQERALRRVDHYSRLALLGAHLALRDAGYTPGATQTGAMGIIIATGYGATQTTFTLQDTIRKQGDAAMSPTQFSGSVHNAAAAHLSIFLKSRGPSLTVSQFEMSMPAALLTAAQWLTEERVDTVLVGGVDEFSEVLGYCWLRYFGMNPSTEMHPLDFDRQTSIAGEGTAFLLLGRAGEQPARYGLITDIRMDRCKKNRLELHPETVLILGADGHRACGNYYRRQSLADVPCACYTPLYGSLPIGPGFDLAIGALAVKEDLVFAAPHGSKGSSKANLISEEESLNGRSIGCLKIDRQGQYALVKMDSEICDGE